MILARVPTFRRERAPEWVIASITLGWGLNALFDVVMPVAERHTMDSPFYQPLLSTGMGQTGWGLYAAAVGSIHLLALIVNGSRPRGSTIMRAVGAGASAFFWAGLVIGALFLPWRSGAIYTYGGLTLIDLFALFYAAREIAPAFHRTTLSYGAR